MARALTRLLCRNIPAVPAAAWARMLCTGAATEAVAAAAAAAAPAAASNPTANKKPGEGLPLYRRLSALGGAPEGSVKTTMNKWLREGKTARAKEIITYVKELRKYGRFQHALELLEWMDMKGMNLSHGNHASRLDLVYKVKGLQSAEKYFNDLPESAQNGVTYCTLLHIYCSENMEDKAMEMYEKINHLNWYPTTLLYNQLIGLFLKNGKPEKIDSLLHEMKEKNVKRDSYTYNILINSYASGGNIEAIEKIIQEIDEKDVSLVRWPVYGNLASIYLSNGLVEKAEMAVKKLGEVMDKKDRLAYHFLISLYARLGNLLEVKKVWASLTEIMNATNRSYLVLLQSLNKLDDFDGLQTYFQKWDGIAKLYDIRLANIMIGAYLKRDMLEEAKSLKDRASSKGAISDRRMFELFIEYYLRKKEMHLALECFKDAAVTLYLWKPNQEMIEAFSKHFEETKDVNGLEEFQKSLMMIQSQDLEKQSHSTNEIFDDSKPIDEDKTMGSIVEIFAK